MSSPDPAVAALHRAVPHTRMTDYGMAAEDARVLLDRTLTGADWTATAVELVESRVAAADAARAAGTVPVERDQLRRAAAAAIIGQLADNADTARKQELYDRSVALVARWAAFGAPPVERLELPDRDGTLFGWLCLPAGGQAAATVVIWGGLSGWGAAYLDSARALTDRGLACVLAEGPGQGDSRWRGGRYVDEQVADGFARFVDAALADPRLGDRVGVQGNSFGGLFAGLLTAADPRIGACVVNGAPSAPVLPEFRTAREQLMAAIGTDDPARVTQVLDALRFAPETHPVDVPLLVLRGGLDPLVTEAEQAPFARAAGERGELRVWPDGEHTLYGDAAERDRVVADFFTRCLLGEPAHQVTGSSATP